MNIAPGQFFPIGLGAEIYYSEGLEKLASNIEEVRPTIMVVVPRLFEVLRQRLIKTVEKQGKMPNYLLGKALGDWRTRSRRQEAQARQADGYIPQSDLASEGSATIWRPDQGDGIRRGSAQS